MPKICVDCRYIGPRPSGIGKVQQALVDYLPGLAPDVEFVFLKRRDAPAKLSDAENAREVVVHAAANSPTTMWWLPSKAPLEGVDLFHATFNIMPAGLAMPCVTTVHDIMWLTNPEWCKARFSRPLEQRFYRHGILRALRRAAAITTVSEASKAELLRWSPDLDGRVHAALLGVSDAYRPVSKAAEHLGDLGLPQDQRIVLTVGQYVPYKNHEGALRIFAEACRNREDTSLVFVQRLSRNAEGLQTLAASLGIADRVHFLEAVDDAKLVALYAAADCLLHPSFCEGFGLPLLEAMACGCPVIASDRSAMPEVLGGAGLLAAVNDTRAMARALRRVLDEPDLAEIMRSAGLARASAFSWKRFAVQNMAVYQGILGL